MVASSHIQDLSSRMWPPTLTTSDAHLIHDFFEPALASSSSYSRGVGFFSSGWLRVTAKGMTTFAANGGTARWVTSPILQEDDWNALLIGDEAQRDSALHQILLKNVADLNQSLETDTLTALAWMVADGILEFRIAVPRNQLDDGDFHDKFGVFADTLGNRMSFNGSYNDSIKGLRNYESIKIFCSWQPAFHPLVESDQARFEKLWANEDPNVRVYTLPEAIKAEILKLRTSERPYEEHQPRPTGVQSKGSLWPHQQDALTGFLTAERGVVEMATGTGKTRLALAICESLTASGEINSIIISADGTDLLDQWHKQLLELVRRMSPRWVLARQYGSYREQDNFLLDPARCVLLSSRHFLPTALKSLTPEQAPSAILIHDEVHRLGSPGNREELEHLSDSIRFRLGLSATPEREYDADGNRFIEEHIGPKIFEFKLEDAIRVGILSPFNYYPIRYTPDNDDKERTRQVYRQVAARKAEGNPMSREEVWIALAKVYKMSKAKLPPFNKFITEHPEVLQRCIIFVETKEYGEEVLKIVHRFHHEFHTYFAEEESDKLKQFARGEIQCLLTCHRLSEGIDIRSLTTVILFSSARAPLETIQRMGRCLRTDPSAPDKVANVIDFVRRDGTDNTDTERADWLNALSLIRPQSKI